jgi:hypothetical protein
MESYEQCGQGRSYCSLCTLDTIHRLFVVTRLIINKINKVQLVDFKLENVLASLHSLKTMGLAPFGASAPLFLRNGELLGHSPILLCYILQKYLFFLFCTRLAEGQLSCSGPSPLIAARPFSFLWHKKTIWAYSYRFSVYWWCWWCWW